MLTNSFKVLWDLESSVVKEQKELKHSKKMFAAKKSEGMPPPPPDDASSLP